MTLPPGSDLLLARERAEILAEILAARSAYVPEWSPAHGGAGRALAEIAAGQFELLQERLRQVPDHRLAVLLDMLGASRLPAQGARTHVLLTAPPNTRGGRIPRGTRFGASVPGRDEAVIFETRQDVAISSTALVEVHTVLPGADAEIDHSADVLGHRPFTLFAGAEPVERELYVGHDQLLAFDGRAVVELELGVSLPAPEPLVLRWSWWDGAAWQPFTDIIESPSPDDRSIDGTAGLTRSGTIRLVAPVAVSKPLALDGRLTHWIRGRLVEPLLLPAATPLPTISRLRIAVVNEHRRLRVMSGAPTGGTQAHVRWTGRAPGGLAVQVKDDTTGSGRLSYDKGDPATTPLRPGTMLPVTNDDLADLSGNVGHIVRLGVSLAASHDATATEITRVTPRRFVLDGDDDLTTPVRVEPGDSLELVVSAGLPIDKGIADRRAVDVSKTFAPLGPSPERGTAFVFACATATARTGSRVTLLIERPESAAEQGDRNADLQRDAVATTIKERDEIVKLMEQGVVIELDAALADLNGIDATLPTLLGPELRDPAGNTLRTAAQWFAEKCAPVITGISTAITEIDAGRTSTIVALAAVTPITVIPPFLAPAHPVAAAYGFALVKLDAAKDAIDDIIAGLPSPVPNGLLAREPQAYIDDLRARAASVRAHIVRARQILDEAISRLKNLSPTALAVQLAQPETTKLSPPRVEWEYHDGTRWRALGVTGDERVLSLIDSGSLHFTVPDDIAEVDVDGDVRRWLRARLAAGTYARMTLVSWVDPNGATNFLPVVEPRPPAIDRIEVFYTHTSSPVDPAAVVAHDDHDWRDLTAAVAWPSSGAAPFAPMSEQGPALYLGLDGELPADRVGLWVHPAEPSPWATPTRPVWEGFDGRDWVPLAVDDGTDGLRHEGVIGLVWPGTDAAPGVTVAGAIGTTVSLVGRGAALRFAPGERLMLTDAQGQLPVIVAAVAGEVVTTRDALARAFAGARLVPAPPARFGAPRTWIRALFDPTRPPPELELARLAVHAVEVEQLEERRDELLGSGDGSGAQVLTAQLFPIAGEVRLEVRELDGDAADLDRDVLARTLREDGVDPDRVRLSRDPRSGRVTEVWVPWAEVSSLGAADGGDRVYVVDRAEGRFAFGDGVHGRPLPGGRDNVRLRSYAVTAGPEGNVPAGAISQLLSPVSLAEVSNPLPASGGARVETLDDALRRAPALVRHHRLALTEADVEAIAVEASPAVVRARVLGARDRWGRSQPGAVRVVIVPRDGSDRPDPTAVLLSTVRDAIRAASPAVAVPRVTVEGPAYRPVGVRAVVAPLRSEEAGPVRERAIASLREFLHPLRGGADVRGWDFGADAHLSDVARLLESLDGVDAVLDLALTVDDVPVGDAVVVRDDEVVCAGPIAVRLAGGA